MVKGGRMNMPRDKRRIRIRNIWHQMRSRCYNPQADAYKYYGDKGIKVCEEWFNSFETFYNWALNNGYADNLTLDRLDSNGNYSPENCKWSTWKEQDNNKSNNIFLTFKEKTQTLPQWSDELGIKQYVIRNRIKRGWDIERALTQPVKPYRRTI